MFQKKEKTLFDNNKHITQTKLPVLNWNKLNPNLITAEMSIVLQQ